MDNVPTVSMEPSTSSNTTMARVPHWNVRLIKEAVIEESDSEVKLLGNEGRRVVWQLCGWLNCTSRGVPGSACRLMERYLSSAFSQNPDATTVQFREKLQIELPLLIAACITLASKMHSSCGYDMSKLVYMTFLCRKMRYTLKEIIAVEMKVFSTLGYRVPLTTMVETGEMLAVEVGLPSDKLCKVAMFVDIAEYERHIITKRVQEMVKRSPTPLTGNVLSLHLTAGAVAAVGSLYKCNSPATILHLACLTNATENYIACICSVICNETFTIPPYLIAQSLKRK